MGEGRKLSSKPTAHMMKLALSFLLCAFIGTSMSLPYEDSWTRPANIDTTRVNLTESADPLTEGKIKAQGTDTYLDCDDSSCSFTEDGGLYFVREAGDDGQFSFRIQGGDYGGMCLDREHCHSSSSNARVSDCGHCGAIHWKLTPDGKLGEDGMSNCIENDGEIRHCSDGNAQLVEFEAVAKPWEVPHGSWLEAGSASAGGFTRSISEGTS